jgi:hypothetical protein
MISGFLSRLYKLHLRHLPLADPHTSHFADASIPGPAHPSARIHFGANWLQRLTGKVCSQVTLAVIFLLIEAVCPGLDDTCELGPKPFYPLFS